MSEIDAAEQRIVDNVRRTGCHINYVRDPDGDAPPFGYSVGFPETVGQPEVIVFGLAQNIVGHMINELLRRCRAGLVLEDGTVLDGLLRGHPCVAMAIPPDNITPAHFNSAMWFRRYLTGEPMDAAFQIVWPGVRDGLFPWDEGCSEEVRRLQPPLIADKEDEDQ